MFWIYLHVFESLLLDLSHPQTSHPEQKACIKVSYFSVWTEQDGMQDRMNPYSWAEFKHCITNNILNWCELIICKSRFFMIVKLRLGQIFNLAEDIISLITFLCFEKLKGRATEQHPARLGVLPKRNWGMWSLSLSIDIRSLDMKCLWKAGSYDPVWSCTFPQDLQQCCKAIKKAIFSTTRMKEKKYNAVHPTIWHNGNDDMPFIICLCEPFFR